MENEIILTVREVKNEIREFLEYADDDFGMAFSGNLVDQFTTGMKPCVGDKRFETEEEAVKYEFQIDERYDSIRHLSDNEMVTEYYNKDKELCYKPFIKNKN